jgi:hypothetical protein
MSMTAAIARMPLRGNSGIAGATGALIPHHSKSRAVVQCTIEHRSHVRSEGQNRIMGTARLPPHTVSLFTQNVQLKRLQPAMMRDARRASPAAAGRRPRPIQHHVRRSGPPSFPIKPARRQTGQFFGRITFGHDAPRARRVVSSPGPSLIPMGRDAASAVGHDRLATAWAMIDLGVQVRPDGDPRDTASGC